MLRKIILPAVILLFTQQEFYGMKGENKNRNEINNVSIEISSWGAKKNTWRKIDYYFNYDTCNSSSARLWWLWAFLDNVPFQYGNSKIWKHGEAYYGLSNGIGFFPSALNIGWLKIGIGDAHINVINFILVGLKFFVAKKSFKEEYSPLGNILYSLCYNFVSGIHLFSFNLLNCVKIKIISIGMIIGFFTELITCENNVYNWYHKCHLDSKNIIGTYNDMCLPYLFLSPRIEINISGINKLFSVEVV